MWQRFRHLNKKRWIIAVSVVGLGWGTSVVYRNHDLFLSHGAHAKDGEPFPGRNQPFIHLPSRDHHIKNLKDNRFDLLVIGGGATGTGVALDAGSRGLNVALVERDDFSCGTSSRSTKLIHGGVRYLEKAVTNFDFGQLSLVFEALHERSNLLNNAPHLTNPLPIMTPCFRWWEPPYYWVGLKMYDLLAGKHRLYPARWVGLKESINQFPMLSKRNLKGTVVYYDGQMDDSRLNVSLALTAAEKGATIANHAEVQSLIKDANGKIIGARIKDTLSSEVIDVYASVVVNATGPFADLIRKMSLPDTTNLITPSEGVHIVLPDYYSPKNTGLIVPKTKDGRVVFMLPWQGETIAGTTDSASKLTFFPQPHEADIAFILEAISDYLKVQVRRQDVRAAWCGIRPLARDPNQRDTASISRDHIIEVDSNGLLTIAGGKWTTYRKMAQDTVNMAIKLGDLKPKFACQTKKLKVIGAQDWEPAFFTVLTQNFSLKDPSGKVKYASIPSDIAEHLSRSYGTRSMRVAELASQGYGSRLAPGYPYLEAEVVYGAQEEYASTAVDILARRIRLAFLDSEAALSCAPRVVELLAQVYNWDDHRKKQELEEAQYFLHLMKVGRTDPYGDQ